MGEGAATKFGIPCLVAVLLFFASCSIVVSVAGDDDACAPLSSTSDTAADATLSPGAKVKPMKSKDFQIASPYGPRDGGFHRGIDLAGPVGAPIYAAADGTVAAAGTASGFGHWIVLNHNINGHIWSTVYGHMYADGVLVHPGERVTAGQHIANRGSDGESTGPHLHFEVWDGGRLSGGHDIDPAGWVTSSPDPGAAPASRAPAQPGGAQAAAAVTPTPAPAPQSSAADVVTAADWDKVAQLEAGGNWSINTGNGYQGGLQFSPSTWAGAGGTQYAPSADKATRVQQMEVANRVLGTQGWGAWPVTSKEAGVTGKKPAPAGSFVNAATAPAPASPAAAAPQQSGPLPPLPASKGSEAHWQIDSVRIARAISQKFPQIKTIGGWRPYDTYPDHPSGRAIDVMIPNPLSREGIELGNAVQKYVMDNKGPFHVVYTIWRQRYTAATGETNIMEDRGGITANHFDHVHVTDEGHGFPTGREVYTAPGVTGGGSSEPSQDCAPGDTPHGGGVDNLAAGKVPAAYEPWFRKAGVLCPQISSALLAGIGKQETGYADLTSPDGAEGPMQFMPATAPNYVRDDDGNGRASARDIGDAVMGAGRYSCENAATIDKAIREGRVKPPADGGAEKLYAEAYNAGVGAVLSAGGEPSGGDYDTQTRPYGANVISYARQFATQGLPQKVQ